MMTDIQGSSDCGNSPKNQFVQQVTIALELGELTSETLSAEIIWHGVNAQPLSGIDAVRKFLDQRANLAAINVHHAISHGKVGAASGEVTKANGHRVRFSHILEFTNARANCVATINSYT